MQTHIVGILHAMAHGSDEPRFPTQPVDRLTRPLERFLHVEAASGVVLLVSALVALVLANSAVADSFLGFWKTPVGFTLGAFQMEHKLSHWINDGLMAIFFFVIGLEVKRELVMGELRDLRRAALPIAGAVGGMVVPAAVYLLLAPDGPAQDGWGIPMATDIAFVVGCMAVLGERVPRGMRVFLLSLAIADDIGAILVIAIGYTASINGVALSLAFFGLALVVLAARIGVRSFAAYTALAVGIWLGFHESGVHATIAGVLLGLLTPAKPALSESNFGALAERFARVLRGDDETDEARKAERARGLTLAAVQSVSPLEYLETRLHPWMGFAIMPIFALANAGVPFHASDIADPIAVAVGLGLLIGKPVGIFGLSFLAVRLGLAHLPEGVRWSSIACGGLLAGIGFTMALFIASLALEEASLQIAKVGILAASAVAAIAGTALLALTLRTSER